MVALKKLFQAERAQSRPSTGAGCNGMESQGPHWGSVESPTRNKLHGLLAAEPPSPALPSPSMRGFQAPDMAHHFDQIDKHFEDLHQHLGERPVSSQSQDLQTVPSRLIRKDPKARHIDLMEAIAPLEQSAGIGSSAASPPTSPYNEDVAERNMTRFLRIQYRSGFASSRILSALYQEDVADRNIAKYSGASRSMSSLSCRSSPPAPRRDRNLSPDGQRRSKSKKPNWNSDGDLRARPASPDTASGMLARESQANSLLRQRRSAPSLSPDEDVGAASPSPAQRLGVPPAYKQGKRWSNTPLPDSPTLPVPMSESSTNSENRVDASPAPRPPIPTMRGSSLTSRSLSPPPASGSSASRKNVRDLSINTELAAQGRPRIAHRAIQPPTPTSYEIKRAPSIAEVMHSPLPEPSPVQPSPRFKVSEMMDLFNKAYMSTHAISPHPTYESLQDAIVREINSHEAFKRVPVPAAGPPFTPSPTQETFDRPRSANSGLSRSASVGSISKIIRKGSFRKHKRNVDSRQSISTSVPPKGYDRIFRKASPSPSRRRHTDAPVPSPGLLADIRYLQETASPKQLTYMDVLLCANNGKPGTSSSKSHQPPPKRGRAESISKLSAIMRANSEEPHTPAPVGTIYCMQAHSASSRDSQGSGSHEDSDDDIIHLPSVNPPPPRVQIEAVDENNVRYVIDSATATDAQRLMSWPQRSRRFGAPPSAPTQCDKSLSPFSRARMQLRGTRSVETY